MLRPGRNDDTDFPAPAKRNVHTDETQLVLIPPTRLLTTKILRRRLSLVLAGPNTTGANMTRVRAYMPNWLSYRQASLLSLERPRRSIRLAVGETLASEITIQEIKIAKPQKGVRQ